MTGTENQGPDRAAMVADLANKMREREGGEQPSGAPQPGPKPVGDGPTSLAPPEEKPKPAPKPKPKAEEKPDSEPEKAPVPSGLEAKLAAKLAGKKPEKGAEAAPKADLPEGWTADDLRALRRAGNTEAQALDLATRLHDTPGFREHVDRLRATQQKTDDDYASLKARLGDKERQPTPDADAAARHSPGDQRRGERVDQPGSEEVAKRRARLVERFGEELGAENAELLGGVLDGLERENQSLRDEVSSLRETVSDFTEKVDGQRKAAQFEVLIQRARHALGEDFPWIGDDEGFTRVVDEIEGIPTEATYESVLATMRKASKIAFFDELKSDNESGSARRNNARKDRRAATAPTGSNEDPDPVLSETEIAHKAAMMLMRGEPKEAMWEFQKRAYARRKAAR